MKVIDLFKNKMDRHLSQQSKLVNWISPMLSANNAIKDYWYEFLHKNDNTQLDITDQLAANDNDFSIVDQLMLSPTAKAVYDELVLKLGEIIHIGDWLVVNQDRIDQFAQVTEDTQWLHTDPIKAANSPFKSTIAHGFLTLALLPRLTDAVDPKHSDFPIAKMVVNIGLNQVRFLYPVRSGSNVRAVSRLTKITPVKKGLELEREITVEIQGIRRPAAVVVSLVQLHF